MSDHALWQMMLRLGTYRLIDLALEFQYPQAAVSRTDLMTWCVRQGQIEHLAARVEEYLRDA